MTYPLPPDTGAVRQGNPWGPISAFFIAVTLVVIQAATVFAITIVSVGFLAGWPDIFTKIKATPAATLADIGNMALFGAELFGIMLVLTVARSRGGTLSGVLNLNRPQNIGKTTLIGFGGLIGIYITAAFIISLFLPDQAADSRAQMNELFSALKQSPFLPLGIAGIVIGAPVFEELVFRGFLTTSFNQTRLGLRGSAVLSSLVWTLLHASYGGGLLAALFLFGLLLSTLTWQSKSIWPAIIAHGIWNGLVTVGVFLAAGQV